MKKGLTRRLRSDYATTTAPGLDGGTLCNLHSRLPVSWQGQGA